MYRKNKLRSSSLSVNDSRDGETIEEKIERIVNNKEPIADGAPLIYTERKDGVLPGHDIRTDRFEVALDATDAIAKSQVAKRENRLKEKETPKEDKPTAGDEAGGQPAEATK